MTEPTPSFLDILACPKCHSPLRSEGESLVCSACNTRFDARSGIPSFLPAHLAERFAIAQAAEEKHHEDSWAHRHLEGFRGVTSIEEYRDWLESFYRMGLCTFGIAPGYFREKTILEIGSGPYGMLGCMPYARGLAIDPLMPSFASYMRSLWDTRLVRVAALGEELPVRSETFDVVVAINTLDHTLEPDKILRETYRALKPGGLLIINNNVKSRAGVLLGNFGERFGIKRLTEVFHPHAFTRGDLIELCQSVGLEVDLDFQGKASESQAVRRSWTWKHRVKRWSDNEQLLWILARKPGAPNKQAERKSN